MEEELLWFSWNFLKVAKEDRLFLRAFIVGFVVEVPGRENLIELLLAVYEALAKPPPVDVLWTLRGWLPRSFFIT